MYCLPLSSKFAVITYRIRGGGAASSSILEPLGLLFGFQVLKAFSFIVCLRNTGLNKKLNFAISSHD